MNLSGSSPTTKLVLSFGFHAVNGVVATPLRRARGHCDRTGTLYNYPIGTRKRVKVLGDEPFRHICFSPQPKLSVSNSR